MTDSPGLRILHVDDVDSNLQVMDHMLQVLGHDPVGSSSGLEAFRFLETAAFDLVLTDYHMPDVSGLDLLRNVRALPGPVRSTPIVVVTADVMSFGATAFHEMGFAGALAKPVMMVAMRRVIASVVEGHGEFIGEGFARASG